jgi:hypothetical protein
MCEEYCRKVINLVRRQQRPTPGVLDLGNAC